MPTSAPLVRRVLTLAHATHMTDMPDDRSTVPPPTAVPAPRGQRAPRVTVIIPTFNRARYLGQAIESVLRQSVEDLELLIVDDGSTDDTRALLDAVTDPRLRVLRQEHRGISAAMNAGLREAKGVYVARLDSDDVWFADLLARSVEVLDASPEIGVVYSRAQAMSADGTPREHYLGLPLRFPDDPLLSLAWGDATCNITAVARRACFVSAGPYDETMRTHEDWDMWLRVARDHRFAFLNCTLARFREHEDGITSPSSPTFVEHIERRRQVIDKLYAAPDLPPRLRAFRPVAYSNVYTEIGVFLLNNGHRARALRMFGRAVASAANPLVACLRILWLTTASPALRQFALGRRLLQLKAEARRRLYADARGSHTNA